MPFFHHRFFCSGRAWHEIVGFYLHGAEWFDGWMWSKEKPPRSLDTAGSRAWKQGCISFPRFELTFPAIQNDVGGSKGPVPDSPWHIHRIPGLPKPRSCRLCACSSAWQHRQYKVWCEPRESVCVSVPVPTWGSGEQRQFQTSRNVLPEAPACTAPCHLRLLLISNVFQKELNPHFSLG